MGNHPSKPPSGPSTSPTTATHGFSSPANDRRVNRRVSIQALSGTKATAADPSASKESATGHSVTHNNQPPIEQRLQSRKVPESGPRSDRPGRYKSERITQGERREMEHRPREAPPEPSVPVQVPSTADRTSTKREQYPYVTASGPPLNTYYGASAHLQRPPRLPLPIGDATATPGSPVIAPSETQAESVPFGQAIVDASHDTSHLSNASANDEDAADELREDAANSLGKSVATKIDWKGQAEKVYVTGTFVNWERKFRMHKSEDDDDGVLTTTLELRPGTHHLKFIVDGDMRTSDHLPTAVDFTNHLVNYIEVSADEIQRPRRESDKATKIAIPPGIYPPQILPETLKYEETSDILEEEPVEEPEEEIPIGDFRSIIPQFLTDIEGDEESPTYQQAANVIRDAPSPPSLPLFLGRSILNGTTPMKDDNSVLNYPNHTVLNHLATSSIKNGVLATSVTTRYKRKYVTTILYKPTSDVTD